MGSVVGVYTDKEVQGLSKEDIALLRRHVVHHIQTSAEIRRIIHDDPKIVTIHPDIRAILRREAGALHKRLKEKRRAGTPRKRRSKKKASRLRSRKRHTS
jgi:hypothetical protein